MTSGNDKSQRQWGGRITLSAAASVLALAVAAPVAAQDADDPNTDESVEHDDNTIIVTAQRRVQTILEVPVSATVLTGEALAENNSQSALDYLKETPNVSFSQGGRNGAREIVISIRGISDLKGGEKVSTQSAFTTFVDEFSVGTLASSQANPNIYDIEAVEVLRGPQGIFFGRNSEAGAINIRTKRPEPELGGKFQVGYGRFNTFELAGVANVPVSDTLYTRLSVQGTKTDSYYRNQHPTGGDGGNEYLNIRGQVRWQPTDATTIDLQVNHAIDNQDYTPKLATCINPTFGFNPFDPNVLGGIGCYDPDGAFEDAVADGTVVLPAGVTLDSIRNNTRDGFQNSREFTDNDSTIYIGKIEHVFNDAVVFTSVTGYAESTQDQYLDLDKSGLDSVDRSGFFETSAFSQEFRLASAGDSRLDWTIGGIYYEEKFDADNDILIKDFLGPWLRGDRANENHIAVDRNGWGIFGNVDFEVTEKLSVIFGLRYSEDDDSQEWSEVFAACPRRALGDPLAAGCFLTPEQQLNLPTQVDGNGNVFVTGGKTSQTAGTFGEKSTKDLSGRLALNFQPNEDMNFYASASKGYKPGGARANPDAGTLANISLYGKEKLWNYEVGGNAYLMDRNMLLQFAVFYMDWRDMQVEVRESFCTNDPANPIPVDEFQGPNCLITPLDRTVNAKKARSKGFELSTIVRPTNALTLRAGVGYVDAKFIDFRDTVRNTPQDLSGLRLGNAPKWTAYAGAKYEFDLGEYDAHFGADWNYRSSTSLGIVQQVGNQFPSKIPSFGIVNLNAGIDFGSSELSVNVKNLLSSDYYTGSDAFSWGGTLLDHHPTEWFVRWSVEI